MGVELAIGEVARRAGVATSAIRFYEREGLLPVPARSSGRRRYGEDVLRRLAVIEVAKRAGFSLAEVRLLLDGFARDVSPSERWRTLAERKLRELDELSARIAAMRELLDEGIRCACGDLDECELLAVAR